MIFPGTRCPKVDYLRVERALSGMLPLDKLNLAGGIFCDRYKTVFDIGRMAQVTAVELANHPGEGRY